MSKTNNRITLCWPIKKIENLNLKSVVKLNV